MVWLLPLAMALAALALLAVRVQRREAAALAAAEGDLARLRRSSQLLARRLDFVARPVEEAPVPHPAVPVPVVPGPVVSPLAAMSPLPSAQAT